MRFRKLRIAWSVVCGAVALLLLIVWVRSYSARSTFEILVTPTHRYYVHSLGGTVAFEREQRMFLGDEWQRSDVESNFVRLKTNAGLKILRSESDGAVYAVCISYWLLVLVSLCISATPWLPLRFSLRTLLAATTLLAVALGLIMGY